MPKLNGIEAAHRISRLVPRATILFISQETDLDVVTEASVTERRDTFEAEREHGTTACH